MRKSLLFWKILLLMLSCLSGIASGVDGFLVSTAMRNGQDKSEIPELPLGKSGRQGNMIRAGKICLARVRNSIVTPYDTIYSATFGRYPTISPDGKKIAFLRYESYIDKNGILQNADGPIHVSIMDTTGKNVVDLVTMSHQKAHCSLDWPLGEWIYYQPLGENAIYRVHTKTPSKVEKVTEYCSFRKFDLNLSGAVAGLQTPAGSTCGYGNILHTFPPAEPAIGKSLICKFSGCNIATSPSGKYTGSFSNTSHNKIQIGKAADCSKHALTVLEMEQLSGKPLGGSQDWPRWSVNSDKWVISMIGARINVVETGGNQVLINWVDREVIKISDNAFNGNFREKTVYWNTAGDFYLTSIPKGHYEDVHGTIVNAATGQSAVKMSMKKSPDIHHVHVQRANQYIEINHPLQKQFVAEIYRLDGSVVSALEARNGMLKISIHTVTPGIHLIIIRDRDGVVSKLPWTAACFF